MQGENIQLHWALERGIYLLLWFKETISPLPAGRGEGGWENPSREEGGGPLGLAAIREYIKQLKYGDGNG